MKGKELRAIRTRLGLSARELGELVGVAGNSVLRWERNEMRITEPVAKLVRIIAGGPVPKVEPRKKTPKK